MLQTYPSWRIAFPYETPGELTPQLGGDMKQITIVLHYEDDQNARDVYGVLKEMQADPRIMQDYSLDLEGSKIVGVKIKGPND